MDDLSKRLLALMQLGCYLVGADGHIWISCNDEEDYPLNDILIKNKISLNSKIYGGVLQSLDTIDAALIQCGSETLLERYNDRIQFLGKPGVDQSRIDKVELGDGGIY